MQRWLSLLLSLLISACVGCGSGLPRTIKVSGHVTFDGQPPRAPGTVYFLPEKAGEGFPSRPATADFDKTGFFKATTFDSGDGLMPGEYIMHVECWEMPPSLEGTPTKSYVPKKYQSAQTSGWKLDITPDMRPLQVTLDVVTN